MGQAGRDGTMRQLGGIISIKIRTCGRILASVSSYRTTFIEGHLIPRSAPILDGAVSCGSNSPSSCLCFSSTIGAV